MEKNKVTSTIIEDNYDIYTDQININETDNEDDMNTCTMRLNTLEDDDDYDWVEPQNRTHKPA